MHQATAERFHRPAVRIRGPQAVEDLGWGDIGSGGVVQDIGPLVRRLTEGNIRPCETARTRRITQAKAQTRCQGQGVLDRGAQGRNSRRAGIQEYTGSGRDSGSRPSANRATPVFHLLVNVGIAAAWIALLQSKENEGIAAPAVRVALITKTHVSPGQVPRSGVLHMTANDRIGEEPACLLLMLRNVKVP